MEKEKLRGYRLVPGDIKPLEHDLNNGYSLGLEYPLIWGFRPERRCWMLWHRETGRVFAYVDERVPEYAANLALKEVAELQTTRAEPFNPFTHDDVS